MPTPRPAARPSALLQPPRPPAAPAPPTLPEQKRDFTAEGAPAPDLVPTATPASETPPSAPTVPPRARRTRHR